MQYRIGFVMEQTLGHVTHAQNFQSWVARDPGVEAKWIPVLFDQPDHWNRVPLVRGNWTLRSSLRARHQLRAVLEVCPLDALFFHTQVTALFAQNLMRRIPTVVSMDATPLNFDSIGRPYDHRPSTFQYVENLKNALNRRTFNSAERLITWHEWGKTSIIRDYRVNGDKVVVIPPGIDLERWNFGARKEHGGPVRLLFVGGDFRRKGGEVLLTSFRRDLAADCTLDIVTREQVDVSGVPQIRVHHGIGPNSPDLMALFAQADLFVFPTFADTLPLVVMEAMASSLPVITTTVGALHEEVDDGVNGFLVPAENAEALSAATLRLVRDRDLRQRMSTAARATATARFNASINYRRVLDVCKGCVDRHRGTVRDR